MLAIWKIAPAIACGNTIILKPADSTPLTALRLAQTFKDVGAPEGLLNVVVGLESVGKEIANHPLIDKISFTGSPEVGAKILAASANSNLKKVTLELGGKSPIVVFADADLDLAVEQIFGAIFANMGQNCVAGSRLYLNEKIHDEFLCLLKTRIEKVKVGDPTNSEFDFGPLVNKVQFERVMRLINVGLSSLNVDGSKLLIGGKRFGNVGYYVLPTVFYNVPESAEIATTEIFGPVLCVMKSFTDFDDVIKRANDTPYGLGAGVFTRDIGTAERFVSKVKAGTVWVNWYNNCEAYLPFGGAKGNSGIGRDLGEAAIGEFTNLKSVVYRI